MAKESSYTRIGTYKITNQILMFLSEQKMPVTPQEIVLAVDLPLGTVMSHIATMEDIRWVRRIGNTYELDMAIALFWARKKAVLAGRIARDTDELTKLEV